MQAAGVVTSVDVNSTLVSNVVTYFATVALTKVPAGVKPGMTASVTITVDRREGVLNLPSAAVRGTGTTGTVTVVNGKIQTTKTVGVGLRGDTTTEITSGLNGGRHGRAVVEHGERGVDPTRRPARASAAADSAGSVAAAVALGRRRRRRGPRRRLSGDAAHCSRSNTSRSGTTRARSRCWRCARSTSRSTRGEYVAIMGASGSGKSTLMNILGCLDLPTRGKYMLAGTDVRLLDDTELAGVRNRLHRLRVPELQPDPAHQRAAQRRAPAGLRGREAARARRAGRAPRWRWSGSRTGPQHKPSELSGGQQQRVAVARAIVTDPAIILADEPTGNLDTTSTGEMLDLLDRLHAAGRTIVLITHEPDVAMRASRVVRLSDGRIVERRVPDPPRPLERTAMTGHVIDVDEPPREHAHRDRRACPGTGCVPALDDARHPHRRRAR